MIGPRHVIENVGGIVAWIIQLDGLRRGNRWVCYVNDLEYARPNNLSPLELLIEAYVAEQRKELGI
jgi:hypothetical protein